MKLYLSSRLPGVSEDATTIPGSTVPSARSLTRDHRMDLSLVSTGAPGLERFEACVCVCTLA